MYVNYMCIISYTSHHFTPHGRYEVNKLTSLPMCGFIAQLVEQRTGNADVTGSSPDFFFFRLLLSNCLNWKVYCDDYSSLSKKCIMPYSREILKGIIGRGHDLRLNGWRYFGQLEQRKSSVLFPIQSEKSPDSGFFTCDPTKKCIMPSSRERLKRIIGRGHDLRLRLNIMLKFLSPVTSCSRYKDVAKVLRNQQLHLLPSRILYYFNRMFWFSMVYRQPVRQHADSFSE